MKTKKTYPGKILLFGEYTILTGGNALTAPYDKVFGYFDWLGNESLSHQLNSNRKLKKFHTYLTKLNYDHTSGLQINLKNFEEDIEQGIFFNSTIPESYGVGSSGALTAAVFDRYSMIKPGYKSELHKLKQMLAVIESYFHGKSSGIDPLSSYVRQPLLFSEREITIFKLSENKKLNIFLLDTGIVGKTDGLVDIFFKRYMDNKFRDLVHNVLVPSNSKAIDSYLTGNNQNLINNLKTISSLQREYFLDMIPSKIIPAWDEGLKSGDYYLKLCGSGGGGYVLEFTLSEKHKFWPGKSLIYL